MKLLELLLQVSFHYSKLIKYPYLRSICICSYQDNNWCGIVKFKLICHFWNSETFILWVRNLNEFSRLTSWYHNFSYFPLFERIFLLQYSNLSLIQRRSWSYFSSYKCRPLTEVLLLKLFSLNLIFIRGLLRAWWFLIKSWWWNVWRFSIERRLNGRRWSRGWWLLLILCLWTWAFLWILWFGWFWHSVIYVWFNMLLKVK